MEEFEGFYKGWVVDQQGYLDQLIRISNKSDDAIAKQNIVDEDQTMGNLIEEVLSHYMRYYEEKAKSMSRDNELLFFFSPPWLTTLEKAFLWIGGFKPCMALSLLEASVIDMSPEQKSKIEELKKELDAEEKAVEYEMERIGGGDRVMWDPPETLAEEMRAVMRSADSVRRETVVKTVEIMSRRQTVKFLVAVGSYQLGMRNLGINFPF